MTCTMALAAIQVSNTAEIDEIDYYKKQHVYFLYIWQVGMSNEPLASGASCHFPLFHITTNKFIMALV